MDGMYVEHNERLLPSTQHANKSRDYRYMVRGLQSTDDTREGGEEEQSLGSRFSGTFFVDMSTSTISQVMS